MSIYDFDKRGNLKPYGKIIIDYNQFRNDFVSSFNDNSSRIETFNNFENRLIELKSILSDTLTIWVDGSFITNKSNPNDIDYVIFIKYESYKKNEEVIKDKYLNRKLYESEKLDVYIVIIYPENNRLYLDTLYNTKYWFDFFTKTRFDSSEKRHSKGFIEIKF